jgi:hypothetical protein
MRVLFRTRSGFLTDQERERERKILQRVRDPMSANTRDEQFLFCLHCTDTSEIRPADSDSD